MKLGERSEPLGELWRVCIAEGLLTSPSGWWKGEGPKGQRRQEESPEVQHQGRHRESE